MKMLLFGYGSLINLKSASKTLKRELTINDVCTGFLYEFERSWSVWDDVFSTNLNQKIKAAFLNVLPKPGALLNGVFIEINSNELSMFKIREKNYNCVDVTRLVTFDEHQPLPFQAYTFSGKKDFFIEEETDRFSIFEKYQEMVEVGISTYGEDFKKQFKNTTIPSELKMLSGDYSFTDLSQQEAR